MSENKFTPGPWYAIKYKRDEKSGYSYYIRSNKGVIGYWRGHKDYHDDGYWMLEEKDARLIAAAPELLEALENMVNIYYGRGGTKSDAIIFSEKAISKAKGESYE